MGHRHFDEAAATWDEEPRKAREAATLAAAITERLGLTGQPGTTQPSPSSPAPRLLEYGAGTGLISQALAPHVDSVTLADNSAGMRQVIEAKVADGRLPAGTRLWALDLERDAVPTERFDLVVASLVLHHVHQVPRVLAGFHELLAPGGHAVIADLDSEDGSFHAHVHDFDGHHGFDRDHLGQWLRAAGFTGVEVRDCYEIDRDGTAFPVFLATALRA